MSAATPPLSPRVDRLQSSAIRDLLELTARSDVISLAGGLPDAELMPLDRIAAAADAALSRRQVLQYTETPGWTALREVLAARESERVGRSVPVGEIVVTHGSQQALSLLTDVLVDPGALVIVEDPAYVGALQVFRAAGARVVAVPLDGEGMRISVLRELLGQGQRPAIVHTVTNFHNPGGVTMSPARRRDLAGLADQYGFWVIEDDPYGELAFEDPTPAPAATYSANVIRLSSTSKILAPALRVGWMVAPGKVCRAVELFKQGVDLCGSALTHQIAAELLADTEWLAAHLNAVRRIYGLRAEALAGAVRKRFGDRVLAREATGGMFMWASFTDGTNTRALLPYALDAGVAYVPGSAFAVATNHARSMRLCFATCEVQTLKIAVDRLARAHNALSSRARTRG